nr:GDSL-type esterase/lipase family protein [Pseudenhygromyxa sp. WMMC2535]
MRRDKGGKLRVRIDGGPDRGGSEVVVDTALSEAQLAQGLEKVDAWERIELEDGPHRVEVRAGGGGLVRAYGVVLEREGPGVVWDGMALIGAFTKRLGEFDDAHLHDQLEHRGLDLMVFTFGGNDMTRADLRETMDPYVEDYAAVIRRFRQARPAAACLIMGPVDHGERVGGRVVSREIVARMTTAQREVALAEGCAFFDTLAAMGGDGAVARWKSESLMSGDLSHPSFKGHALLGAMVYRALMAGYVDFRRAQAGQPMTTQPEPAQPD